MTEQPDTAAEARIAELERTIEGNWRQIGKQGREILNLHAREEEDRIRMEGAEARIAAALDIHRPGGCFCIGTHPCPTSRALTEGISDGN